MLGPFPRAPCSDPYKGGVIIRMFPLTAASFIMLIAAIVAFFGGVRLLAASHSNSVFAKGWLALGF